ncbi:MAG: 6-carboxytetrahydropterin synthase [Planctomycetaceae bacterium]|jgi:6-pyruvoyltetrahydropterin/6-carboxytetrahydropterin synthase|nr:6-carboxytetrahydropterin synthase [Planctomycetaceae bacterium]
MAYSIRFDSDTLSFPASHFITFGNPEKIEALHGHNFRVRAEIMGPLGKLGYVIDFLPAYDALKKICDTLSHKILLPANHPYIKIRDSKNGTINVTVPPLRWSFPSNDTLVLPLINSTTELLAEYIAKKFHKTLEEYNAFEYETSKYKLKIEIEEAAGMWAVYE